MCGKREQYKASKRWRDKNKEYLKAKADEWLAEHPGYKKAYAERNKDKMRDYQRTRYLTKTKLTRDMNKVVESNNRWRRKYPDKLRAQYLRRHALKKGAAGSFTAEQWGALKAFYGYKCLACGVHESISPLTVDHVLPLAKGGSNDITNLQPLCRSCNSSKKDKHVDYRLICLLENAA